MENSKVGPSSDEHRKTYMAEFGLSDEHVGNRVPSLDLQGTVVEGTADHDNLEEARPSTMDPVELARSEVKLAEAQFSHQVRRVSDVSELAVREAWTSTRPLLVGALLIGGASATLALVAAVRTFRRRAPVLIRHEQAPSAGTPVIRSILMSVGLLVMRRVAERALDRFQAMHEQEPMPSNSDQTEFSRLQTLR